MSGKKEPGGFLGTGGVNLASPFHLALQSDECSEGELSARPVLASASPVLCTQRQLPAPGPWEGFAFLSLSQAAKPDTCGQNYSSHRAVRQQEEGALRAEKENKERKKTLPVCRGERARGKQQVNLEGEGCRMQDGGPRRVHTARFSLQGM